MFSRAENDVINYLVTGMSNFEIADKLCVSEKTIKFHLTNIYSKAEVKSRFEFIAKNNGTIVKGDQMAEYENRPLAQGSRAVQVVGKSQEDKITFIDEKFRVGETISQLHSMMKDVTKNELTPNTVNAACNCVARLNETINTAIQAAKFLNER